MAMLTIEAVAEELDVHRKTVLRLIASGELPAYRIRTTYRIRPEDLDKLLRRGRVTPSGKLL